MQIQSTEIRQKEITPPPLANRSPSTIAKWLTHKHAPKPIRTSPIGGFPIYDREEVLDWLQTKLK